MRARFHLWLRKLISPQLIIEIIVLLVIVIVITLGYWFKWGWTGFLNKSLWDWLQLLFVPIILAIGGFWLNQIQANITEQRNAREKREEEQRAIRENAAAEQRAQTERDIALDYQRETALQDYIDKISELLLAKNLRKSSEDDEVRSIAQVRTLTVLPRLDSSRKRIILQFLYQSKLIERHRRIIDLNGADFNRIDLSGAELNNADLSGAKLKGANLLTVRLEGAELYRTDLEKASLPLALLSKANLTEANLVEANLEGAYLLGTKLKGAYLDGANLGGADLREADLSDANLQGANLSEGNLPRSWPELWGDDSPYGADLSGAELNNADLRDANLYRAKVTSKQLDEVASLQGATMPNGSIHPK